MDLKKIKVKLFLVFVILSFFVFSVYLIVFAMNQNINLYYTPTQIFLNGVSSNKLVKIGGFVKENSVKISNSLSVFFEVTDYNKSVLVKYDGLLPDLFSEKNGILVIGFLCENGIFEAKQVLAKHDENYVPVELSKSLEKIGKK